MTAAELTAAIEKGYRMKIGELAPGNMHQEMLHNLRKNVHLFSGFKNYHMLREATDKLVDETGALRSFAAFKDEVLKLHNQYNVSWLEAEYNHAVSSSQMASKWVDIQETKETLPLLQYITAGDGRVRADHQALEGITLPVDDPFWNKFYPPNDWNCRCQVRQLADGNTTPGKVLAEKQELLKLKSEFDGNIAKDGVLFPPTHPYYKVQSQHQAQANTNWGINIPD